jgi:hypothetical protein
MPVASYRSKFLEILCQVCDLATTDERPDDFNWRADYIARNSLWYRFQGHGCSFDGAADGRLLDIDTGHVQRLSPSLMSYSLLEFDCNELIAAYNGPNLSPVCVAQGLVVSYNATPEIVSLHIERTAGSELARVTKIETSIIFVGFKHPCDAGPNEAVLARAASLTSRHWYHERHFFGGAAV